jgi:hypothetical protein
MFKKLIIFIMAIGLGSLGFAQIKPETKSEGKQRTGQTIYKPIKIKPLEGQSTSLEKKIDIKKELAIEDASLIDPELPLPESIITAGNEEKGQGQEASQAEQKEKPEKQSNEDAQSTP